MTAPDDAPAPSLSRRLVEQASDTGIDPADAFRLAVYSARSRFGARLKANAVLTDTDIEAALHAFDDSVIDIATAMLAHRVLSTPTAA